MFIGFSGDFCQLFQTISLYWLILRLGLSILACASWTSSYAANAACRRVSKVGEVGCG